jgi:hypothetical protein
MRLLRDIADGSIDVVVARRWTASPAMARTSNWLGKRLPFHRVRLFTHIEREIDDVELAVAGLLGSMFLTNLRTKTFAG